MSIIHDALKKAALEGASEVAKSQVNNGALMISTQLSGRYRWLKVSLSIIALSVFFFSARYLSPILLTRFGRPTVSPLNTLQKAPPTNPIPTGTPSQSHLSNETELPDSKAEEGKRFLTEGTNLYYGGKIEEAGEAFQKSVELLPLSPVAHNNLGIVLRHQGKTSEALNHYREAIRLDPNYSEAENNLALIYDQSGSVDEAAIHYKRAIEIEPSIPEFHLNYATLLERKGDFSNARKEYQTYLNLETNHQSKIIPIVRSHLDRLRGF